MLHSNLELVKHIHDECGFILNYTKDLSFDAFSDNLVLRKAVERSPEIIGEACKKISSEFKADYPEVAWKEIAATRNIIIHNYAGVDYSMVWEIITNDIPELDFQIKNILRDFE